MNTDKAWERLGKTEPYFGVLSAPRFEQPGDTEKREFFERGAQHVEWLSSMFHELGHELAPRRALDFGCGVGRVTIPLARISQEVVGADVSQSVLAEAQKNAAELSNVQFVGTDDTLSSLNGRFDFVHSYIVFQHIPPARGLRMVQILVDHLEEGGWAALHFVYATTAPPWWRAASWVRRNVPLAQGLTNVLRGNPIRRPYMQMNLYPLDRLFALLQQSGCHRVSTRFSRHGYFDGVMVAFQRGALPVL